MKQIGDIKLKGINYYTMCASMGVMSLAFLTSCFGVRSSSAGGEVTGVGGSAWAEPTPYGMVLIDRGSIAMGPAKDDSVRGIKADPRGISVDAFWMD